MASWKRNSLIIVISLLIVFSGLYLGRDFLVGIILEKHTMRTCSKLLGGECSFVSRKREGNALTLYNVTVHKEGMGTAHAKDLTVSWEYDWRAPFIVFDVQVHHLEGDAGMLPLYGVWKAVKHASLRRGIRLRSWSFEDVALDTPTGKTTLPKAILHGNQGNVQAEGICELPTQGKLILHSNSKTEWGFRLESASIPEVINLLGCIQGLKTTSLPKNLEGEITAEATYTPAGLKGDVFIERLVYDNGAHELSRASLQLQADAHLKNWNIKGNFGTSPLSLDIHYTLAHPQQLKGTFKGKNIPILDLLPLAGLKNSHWNYDGTVDIDGEFDTKGIFATLQPKMVKLHRGDVTLLLDTTAHNNSAAKIWVDYSKGLERIWLDLNQAHLLLGKSADITVDANLELGKNSITTRNLHACCGELMVDGELLTNTSPDGSTWLIAQENALHIGAWNIEKFIWQFDPKMQLVDVKIAGNSDAKAFQDNLKSLGIMSKHNIQIPGKLNAELTFTAPNTLNFKGKLDSELFTVNGKVHGILTTPHRLDLKTLEASLAFPFLGKVAKYSLADSLEGSYIDFSERYLQLLGQIIPSGKSDKNTAVKEFKISGPWNQLAYEE